MINGIELIKSNLEESIQVKQQLLCHEILEDIQGIADIIVNCFGRGGKLLVCGNGGSASDSLHMVGEIVGRFKRERSGLPAICLNADPAVLTAVANDYGYDEVFSRCVEAYMQEKDVLLGVSTSGNSENVYRAIIKAKEIGGTTLALLGKDGGKIASECDLSLIVPSDVTPRIQEAHIAIIHSVCEIVENISVGNN